MNPIKQDRLRQKIMAEKQLNTRVPYEIWKAVKIHCLEKDMTIQQFIIRVLQKELGIK